MRSLSTGVGIRNAIRGTGFDGTEGAGYRRGAGDWATLAVGLAQAGADVAVCDLGSDETWEGLSNTVWQIRNCGQVGLAVDLDVQELRRYGRRSGRWRMTWAGWTSW